MALGEHYGQLLASLSDYRTDPYSYPDTFKAKDIWSPMLYNRSDSPVKSALALPFKLSMYGNIGRMAFTAGREYGLFSSISRPFRAERQMWRANKFRLSGIMSAGAGAAEGVVNTARSFYGSYRRDRQVFDILTGKDVPTSWNEFKSTLKPKKFLKDYNRNYLRVDDYKKVQQAVTSDVSNLRARLSALREKASSASSKREYRSTVNQMHDEAESFLKNKGRLYEGGKSNWKFKNRMEGKDFRNEYFINPRKQFTASGFEKILMRPDELTSVFREHLSEEGFESLGGKAGITDKYLSRMYHADFSMSHGIKARIAGVKSATGAEVSAYKTAQRLNNISLGDIVLGRGGEGGFFRNRTSLIKEVFTPGEGRTFSMWISGNRKNARVYADSQAAKQKMMAEGGFKGDTGAMMRDLAKGDVSMINRMRLAKVVKFGTFAVMGTAIAASLARTALRYGNETVARATSTVKKLTAMDFGGGRVLNNSRLATERQRAIEAISNAQMNARYLLGNEASLYHY